MTTLLRGTMLAPGVSANRRLYTAELIRRAYDKLTERIKSGTNPVTMLTHHEAGDNSIKIVGRVTGVSLTEDGKLDYTAELADTKEANTIAELVAPKKGDQFLRGVSIRGWWVGEPTTKVVEGMTVTTADDMEIDGLDFTRTPGVSGAFVVPADSTATESSGGVRTLITESVDSLAVFTEAVNTKPYGSVRYADPGYQSDKVKRYPLDTKAHAKAAWSYINQAKNQKQYTAAQLKRIRARIKDALRKFGVNVTTEAADMPEPLTEANTTISEYYSVEDPSGRAGFSISAYNGPLTVSVCAYDGIDPADLADVAAAAMKAACDAIHALDPDDDGDIDTGTSEEASSDEDQMETAPASSDDLKESAVSETTAPTTEAASADAPAVEETTAPAAVETPASPVEEAEAVAPTTEESADTPLTRADLEAAVAAAVSAALNPPQEAAEAAPAADDNAELRETIRKEVLAEALASGVITRKGLVENNTEAQPEKPLHEMNEDEFRAYQEKRSALFFAHNQ